MKDHMDFKAQNLVIGRRKVGCQAMNIRVGPKEAWILGCVSTKHLGFSSIEPGIIVCEPTNKTVSTNKRYVYKGLQPTKNKPSRPDSLPHSVQHDGKAARAESSMSGLQKASWMRFTWVKLRR